MSPLPRHLLRDEPLARLAADGDGPAFDVLFGRYRTQLLRCSRAIVRHDHDAQDVVQSTALKALAGLPRRRDGVPFRPWLFRIAYNEAISVLRTRRARPAAELERTVAHPAPGPAQHALQRAELRALIDDLDQLTDGQRTALLLRQLNGFSYEEIADVLQTTPLAARRSVSTARGNLAAFAHGRDAGCASILLTLAAGDRRAMRTLAVRAHLRSCESCRAQAARPGRGARAAAFIPVPVWELLAALRGMLTPAGAGVSDGLGAPVTKALAVAAAVTVGAGAGVGSLHAPTHTSSSAGATNARAQVPAVRHRARSHAAPATPAIQTTSAPGVVTTAIASAPVREVASVHHTPVAHSHRVAVSASADATALRSGSGTSGVAISTAATSTAATPHRSPHADPPTQRHTAHHAAAPDDDTSAPVHTSAPTPTNVPIETSEPSRSASSHAAPTHDAPPTGDGTGTGTAQDQSSPNPPPDTNGPPAPQARGPSGAHMDSSQMSPHNDWPAPLS
jgi:RNA polymerase sigma factor (sigma-70 family)